VLLAEHLVAIVVEDLAAPAEEPRMVRELVGLLHDVGGVLVGLVKHVRLQQALDLEADVVDRVAALLEQLCEVGDRLLELLRFQCLLDETLGDLEVVESFVVLLVDGVVGLDCY
jgi:hypothetical protein